MSDLLELGAVPQWCPTWSGLAIAPGCGTALWPRKALEGATVLPSPAAVLVNDAVVIMLSNDTAVRSVIIDSGALLPAAEIVCEHMLEAIDQGLGSKDWAPRTGQLQPM